MSDENNIIIANTPIQLKLHVHTPRATVKNPAPQPESFVVPAGLSDPNTAGDVVEAILRHAEELKPGGAEALVAKVWYKHIEAAYLSAVVEGSDDLDEATYITSLCSARIKGELTEADVNAQMRAVTEELVDLSPYNSANPEDLEKLLAANNTTMDDIVRRLTAARQKYATIKAAEAKITEKKAARAAELARQQADPAYKAQKDAEKASRKAKAAK